MSLWAVLNEPLAYGLSLVKNTCAKLQGFRDLIAGFAEGALQKNAYEVGQDIVRRSGIIAEVYRDRTPENLSRQENVEELINGMHDFCASREEEGNERVSLSDYLSERKAMSGFPFPIICPRFLCLPIWIAKKGKGRGLRL